MKTLQELYDELRKALDAGAQANAEKIATLEAQINELKASMATQANAQRADTSIGYKATGNPDKDFSWLRFLDGVMCRWDDRTRRHPEYELTMEATAKAQLAGVDTAGGFMVAPEVFVDQIIPALEPRVAVLNAGATMVTDLVGSPVEWPRFDNYLSGYWTAENAEPSEGSLENSQMSLQPHGLATLVELTQRLVRQTSGRAETAIRQALARGLARTLDLAVFKGTGGTQPVGILNQLNVGTVDASGYSLGTSGASQKITGFLDDMVGKLEDADALMGKPVWFMHPHTRRWFRKYRDASGRPLLFGADVPPTASTLSGPAGDFYGYAYSATTALTGNNSDADLVMANVEEILIGQWGGLSIDRDTSLGFKKGTVWLKASMEVDVGLEHGQSVSNALNLDTTTAV